MVIINVICCIVLLLCMVVTYFQYDEKKISKKTFIGVELLELLFLIITLCFLVYTVSLV